MTASVRKPLRTKLPSSLMWMLFLSLAIHLASLLPLSIFTDHLRSNLAPKSVERSSVKVKIQPPRRIAELKQKETDAPQEANYQSFENHKAEKETRLSKLLQNPKAADVGATPRREVVTQVQERSKPLSEKMSSAFGEGKLSFALPREKKSAYGRLLPDWQELSQVVDAGYQEHLDEEIPVGDRVDINTTEFRYMGYMTSMRKAIELVWNYPMEAAQRGMQGEVGLEFVILKSGQTKNIKVVKSSGYKILDDSIIEAIKLASPFSPLPDGFGKERILITGSFRYILSSWMAGH